jgi:hypothetical protein
MRYEAPELSAMSPAVVAIQGTKAPSSTDSSRDDFDTTAAYEDWE